MSFRLKLVLAMMLLVVGVTATTLLITENQVRVSSERHFQQSFKIQIESFLQQREGRLEPVKQRVANAAANPRLLAAMDIAGQPHPEQRDIDDLYQNGIDQLSDIIAAILSASQGNRTNVLKGYYFFLNNKGEILYPSGEAKLPFSLSGLRRVSRQIETVGALVSRNNEQEVGYLAPEEKAGRVSIREMVFTPIVDQARQQKLGVLGVSFPLPRTERTSTILSAISLDNQLYSSSIPAVALKDLEPAVGVALAVGEAQQRNFTVNIGDVPYQVYCQPLISGPGFPAAYQVCLYSLADATAEKQRLVQKVLVSGTAASLFALVLSWLISKSLTVPLQELVVGTTQIEQGNYTAKVPVRSPDEVGRLGHAFNAMAERVQASHTALEQRIAERTHELEERKRAEAALRKSEESLRQAQRIAHLGNWEWDISSNALRWSEEVCAIFGIDRTEFGGTYQAFLQCVHPADRQRIEQVVNECLDTGKPYSVEHRVVRPNGEVRIVREQAEVFQDVAGKTIRMVGTVQDITEQKRIEAEFLRAQRMDSIGALAGGMAHDLNNSLSPILMGIQLIGRKVQDPEIAHMLKVMEANTHRGADMVRQVLTFARGRDGDRELNDVGRLLREMEHIARQTLPKTINVVSFVPQDLWPVLGNGTQLHQVLLNLCINARDAMPQGGQLTLAADNVELTAAEAQAITNASAGPYVMLLVSDTGTGIAPEILPRLFEPFFTTKGLGQGTGLGLSTIARIVRNHGGAISIKSEVGAGSTFEIYFPRAIPDSAPAPRLSMGQFPRGGGELILLLEDDRSVREIVAASLSEYGYRVVVAESSAEVGKLLSQHEQKLNLILSAPALDGITLLKTIRARCPKLPVIIMSGELESALGSPLAGSVTFLPKPFPLEQLLTVVAAQLNRGPRQIPSPK